MFIYPDRQQQWVKQGSQVLEDSTHEARLQDQQIDDEHGVVLEEYRLGMRAGERVTMRSKMISGSCSQRLKPKKMISYKSDKVRDELMKKKPKMGSVSDESTNDKLGTTTLKLSNGAKVVCQSV